MANPILGASTFPAGTVTDVTTAITTTVSDNIATVLGVLLVFVGIRLALRMLSGAVKGGKLRV